MIDRRSFLTTALAGAATALLAGGMLAFALSFDEVIVTTDDGLLVIQVTGEVVGVDDVVKLVNRLQQNYPNPFNPTTKIPFTISKSAKISIDLFNILGQKVKTLVNDIYPAGAHSVKLNGTQLAAGVYFYRMKINDKSKNYVSTRRLLLLK